MAPRNKTYYDPLAQHIVKVLAECSGDSKQAIAVARRIEGLSSYGSLVVVKHLLDAPRQAALAEEISCATGELVSSADLLTASRVAGIMAELPNIDIRTYLGERLL